MTIPYLKLPSLFTAWLSWTFHNKSHNMKTLVILSHSWSPFLLLTCLYGIITLMDVCAAFLSIFVRKTHDRLSMQITWLWPPVGRFIHALITVKKCEHNVVKFVWEFDCLHYTQYMPMSPHDIGYKQTWYPPYVR